MLWTELDVSVQETSSAINNIVHTLDIKIDIYIVSKRVKNMLNQQTPPTTFTDYIIHLIVCMYVYLMSSVVHNFVNC